MSEKGLLKNPLATRRGVELLHSPTHNKGTAFTREERDLLGLRGLLPPRISSEELQVRRVMENLRAKSTNLERYILLAALQDRNENLFYRVVIDHLKELMPIIYTPTVGEACQKFGHIFRRPRGLYLSANDKGSLAEVMDNWPQRDVRVIVVTDGERILGLGDLGADGMGIPIGKLALYSACAGIHPTQCLPITLDVGTENPELLHDPLYIGLPQRRLRGQDYDDFIEEFVQAVIDHLPQAVLQFEDFANRNAFRLLKAYRDRHTVFNDDIQGTASVTLAGLLSALRLTGQHLKDQRVLFYGAGEAGIGIGDLLTSALVAEGMDEDEARTHSWFMDSTGLVVDSRDGLAEHKLRYAHPWPGTASLVEAIESVQPTALIGVSGQPGAFTREAVETMSKLNDIPIIFALSNPTSKSECTARQAYTWSDGRCIFASGSPFDMVEWHGHTFVPGQANNAYIFPGVGLGLIVSEATRVPDELFAVAAHALAEIVTERDLSMGRIFPSLARIREVSAHIAVAVARRVYELGLSRTAPPEDLEQAVREAMYDPEYPDYTTSLPVMMAP
ncbi:MAG: NAD-dependent malic enzyme [Bacteroidetes bacterium]|nr:NAD-dependent malic enzyme [Bacteroidota bacterium]MDA0873962.1 NAD-dependent malic enzyme [Bacteroidota bacterium]